MPGDAPTDPELIRFLRDELGTSIASGGAWSFTGPLWLWRGKGSDGAPTKAAWHFITIDGATADALREAAPGRMAAWGSIAVAATIGNTGWKTSVFPSKDVGGFLLPVKASVRKAERIVEGDVVTVHLAT